MTPPELGLCIPITVVAVHDGDTATVEFRNKLNIRLEKCWAPELKEPGGKESGDNLRAVALGKPGRLFVPRSDHIKTLGDLTSMGRIVGYVWLDGESESLNAMQIRTQHASTRKGDMLGT